MRVEKTRRVRVCVSTLTFSGYASPTTFPSLLYIKSLNLLCCCTQPTINTLFYTSSNTFARTQNVGEISGLSFSI
jgi:hypothetical protein